MIHKINYTNTQTSPHVLGTSTEQSDPTFCDWTDLLHSDGSCILCNSDWYMHICACMCMYDGVGLVFFGCAMGVHEDMENCHREQAENYMFVFEDWKMI